MTDRKLADELANAEREPFLPIERTLVRASLGLGIVLLVVLSIASRFLPT